MRCFLESLSIKIRKRTGDKEQLETIQGPRLSRPKAWNTATPIIWNTLSLTFHHAPPVLCPAHIGLPCTSVTGERGDSRQLSVWAVVEAEPKEKEKIIVSLRGINLPHAGDVSNAMSWWLTPHFTYRSHRRELPRHEKHMKDLTPAEAPLRSPGCSTLDPT